MTSPTSSPPPGRGNRVPLGARSRRLLSEAVQIEEQMVPAFVRTGLIALAVLVAMFLTWAGFASLREVANAPGEIIPSGRIRVVQHLDGGIVEQILVTEGQRVSAGQPVLRLDGAQALADLRQMESRLSSLRLRAERLAAIAEGRAPDFAALAARVPDLRPDLIEDQRQIYANALKTRESTRDVLIRQIDQRRSRLDQIIASLEVATRQQRLSADLLAMRERLAEKRLITQVDLLETRRAKIAADGEVQRLQEEISVTRQEMAEAKSRLQDSDNQRRRETLSELGAISAEIAELEEAIQRQRARAERLDVRSPENGVVQDLKISAAGQVIQSGAVLMQIVPDDETLVAEVRIAPSDIGYVTPGQPVEIRVSAYEYARFGTVRGTLERVSPSSLLDDQGRPHFRGWVSLAHPYVGNDPGRYRIRTGMSVEAVIQTGEKSLLAYLFKPMADALSRSFQER